MINRDAMFLSATDLWATPQDFFKVEDKDGT